MNELIAFIVTGGALAGGIVWVVKILIAKSIEAGVKTYELRLDKELESHRHQLELMKIQYSTLNDKRGEFIAKLFSRLYELEVDLQNYTSVIQPNWTEFGEPFRKVKRTLEETQSLYERNRLYLDETLCKSIDENFEMIRNTFFNMSKAKHMGSALNGPYHSPVTIRDLSVTDLWGEQDEKARKDIVENRMKLAEQFRALIGVGIETKKTL